MPQIDKIIIRFEVHGGQAAQAIISGMNRLLAQTAPVANAAGKGQVAFASATARGSSAQVVFGNVVQSNILKISEFAVVLFAVISAYNLLIKPIVEVQKNMKVVESVSHATRQELELLEKEAIRLGTIFPGGAAKATKALVSIGQAGYNARQAMQLMEPALMVATIGEIEMAESTEFLIQVLNGFRLNVSEAGRVADVFAASISHTLTTVETFRTALPPLSALAYTLNVTLEETVAILGFLTDIGIPASKTATALKNVFTHLTKSVDGLPKSMKEAGLEASDLDVQLRGLIPVLQSLADADLNAVDVVNLFGLRAIYAADIIDANVIPALTRMITELKLTGEASYQSGIILEATSSKWAQLGGTIQENINAYFAPLLKALDWIIDGLKNLIRALSTAPTFIKWLVRNLMALVTALTALSVIVRVNILLFKSFIYEKGIALAIPYIKSFIGYINMLYQVLLTYRAGLISASVAQAVFTATLSPIVAALKVVAAVAAAAGVSWAIYKASAIGATHAMEDNARELVKQQGELKGLISRLSDAKYEYDRLEAANKDTSSATAEFRSVLADIIEKFPQLVAQGDIAIAMFADMDTAVITLTGHYTELAAEAQAAMDVLAEHARRQFGKEVLDVVSEAKGKSFWEESAWRTPREEVEDIAKKAFGIDSMADIAKAITVGDVDFGEVMANLQSSLANMPKEVEDLDWSGMKEGMGLDKWKEVEKSVNELLNLMAYQVIAEGKEAFEEQKRAGKPSPMIEAAVEGVIKSYEDALAQWEEVEKLNAQYIEKGALKAGDIEGAEEIQKAYDYALAEKHKELALAAIEELKMIKATPELREGSEALINEALGKMSSEVLKALFETGAITEAELRSGIAAGARGGGAGAREEPAYRAEMQVYRNRLKEIESGYSYDIAEYERDAVAAGKDRSEIDSTILEMQKAKNKEIYDEIGLMKKSMGLTLSTLTDKKEIAEVEQFIFDLEISRVGVLTTVLGIVQSILEVKKEIAEEEEKAADEEVARRRELYRAKLEFNESIRQYSKELKDADIFGKMFDSTALEIAESQLSIVTGEIQNLSKTLDSLYDGFERYDMIEMFGLEFVEDKIEEIKLSIVALEALYESLTIDIADYKAQIAAEDIYDSVEASFSKAIANAILSGNVKDALNQFGDMIKQVLAEKLADQLVDSMLGGLQSGLSQFMGGSPGGDITKVDAEGNPVTTPGGVGFSAFMAQAMPYIGGALLLASIFGGGKNKIDEMNTKLDYILRGGGYQLPSSFLLPEDEGEFSARRRGKDSFAVRFPKRNLNVNITHRFEWSPSELAKAVATDMSVGAMSSIKQYSLIGGE